MFLTLPVAFLISYSDTLINTATVYHLVLFVSDGLGIDSYLCSMHGSVYDIPCIYPPGVMITNGEFSPGFL